MEEEKLIEKVQTGEQNLIKNESPKLPDEFILKASKRESGIKGIAQQVEKKVSTTAQASPKELRFKGGRREIEIASGRAVIRTNGNEYDATGILGSLKKAGVDVRDISENQWAGMLRGQGTALDPSRPKSLFSIQKQVSGYSMRIADITGSISTAIQKEP